MGIRGLETFIDSIYQSANRSAVFTETRLADLRLVIDGNHFAYLLASMFAHGMYGGNYDTYHAHVRALLIKLRPAIEIVIFDGAKQQVSKGLRRLDDKIARVGDFASDVDVHHPADSACRQQQHQQQHNSQQQQLNEKLLARVNNLREHPSLFNRMILFQLLDELHINYMMSESAADPAIALYASGDNPSRRACTVFTKASFFNIYRLEAGYLSTKYAYTLLRDYDKLDMATARVHVYHVDKLLAHFGFKHHATFVYFCVLLGNNDDVELTRNTAYMRARSIDTRRGNFMPLVAHLAATEDSLHASNYASIRKTYEALGDDDWRSRALQKIDGLFDLFAMRGSTCTPIVDGRPPAPCSPFVNDYVRLRATCLHLKSTFVPCLVEDVCNEVSAFEPALDIVKSLLGNIVADSQADVVIPSIDLYMRVKDPSAINTIKKITFSRDELLSSVVDANNNQSAFAVVKFMSEASEMARRMHIEDDLTMMIASLATWNIWLKRQRLLGGEADRYVNSLLVNFVILSAKMALSTQVGGDREIKKKSDDTMTQRHLATTMAEEMAAESDEEQQLVRRLVSIYDDIVAVHSSTSQRIAPAEVASFFKHDVPVIHRINEFQAVYYMCGALAHESRLHFRLLYPHAFLNSQFVCEHVRAGQSGNGGNQTSSDQRSITNKRMNELNELLAKSVACQRLFEIMQSKHKQCVEILLANSSNIEVCANKQTSRTAAPTKATHMTTASDKNQLSEYLSNLKLNEN